MKFVETCRDISFLVQRNHRIPNTQRVLGAARRPGQQKSARRHDAGQARRPVGVVGHVEGDGGFRPDHMGDPVGSLGGAERHMQAEIPDPQAAGPFFVLRDIGLHQAKPDARHRVMADFRRPRQAQGAAGPGNQRQRDRKGQRQHARRGSGIREAGSRGGGQHRQKGDAIHAENRRGLGHRVGTGPAIAGKVPGKTRQDMAAQPLGDPPGDPQHQRPAQMSRASPARRQGGEAVKH